MAGEREGARIVPCNRGSADWATLLAGLVIAGRVRELSYSYRLARAAWWSSLFP
jgi:hypothetical protein